MRELPIEIFGNYPKTEDELVSCLGRKWKVILPMLYKLASNLRYCPRTRIRTVELGLNSQFMLSMYGYPQKAQRMINLAMKIGMIALVDMTYNYHGKEHRSRRFAVNREVVDLVLKAELKVPVCANVLFNVTNTTNNTTNYMHTTTDIIKESKETYTIKDPSKLLEISIDSERRDMGLCDIPDDILIAALLQRYPQIVRYRELSEAINDYYGEDSVFKLRVRPSVERHGMQYVTFRFRASSPFCSVVKASRRKPECCDLCREEILEEKFGIYTRYDVKSSIYRVTWMLNNGGRWPEEDIDFYGVIYGGKFSSEFARDNFKMFCQLVYFNCNDRKCLNAVRNAVKEGRLAIPEEYGDTKILEMIADARESMYDAIGEGYGSEIFLHESFIYMDVLYRLLTMGYDVIEVYDCFYVKGECPELPSLCRCLIETSAREYYDLYVSKE